MKRYKVMKEIDELFSLYCDGCFLKTHHRKAFGKAYAHSFCIKKCTVGAAIQTKGKNL
ncbi:zinc-finger domain-containing protein [Bacillus sp. FSL K6-3431]|uniref:zinc-finger domain-containing protein n=1 Tax=Bacillus sp. FSL K6-3431 TaxID=2921500 RepID=UPI0030F7F798